MSKRERKITNVGVRMTPEQYMRAIAAARADGVTVQEVLRRAIPAEVAGVRDHVTPEELDAQLQMSKTSTSQLERHITSLFNRLPLRNRLDLASGLMASVTREIHPHEDPNPELPL